MEVIIYHHMAISLWSKLHQKEERARDAGTCSACMSYGDTSKLFQQLNDIHQLGHACKMT